jgi:hypothetical protein
MTYRRRHRWLRRIALGFAFATFAAPAAAKPDQEGAGSQSRQVIPYLSHGIVTQEQADALQPAPSGDELAVQNAIVSRGSVDEYVAGVTDFPKGLPVDAATRPDDRSDRFAHSDVAARPELASNDSSIEWSQGMTIGTGAVLFALALGLGLGYLSRPRLVGH